MPTTKTHTHTHTFSYIYLVLLADIFMHIINIRFNAPFTFVIYKSEICKCCFWHLAFRNRINLIIVLITILSKGRAPPWLINFYTRYVRVCVCVCVCVCVLCYVMCLAFGCNKNIFY